MVQRRRTLASLPLPSQLLCRVSNTSVMANALALPSALWYNKVRRPTATRHVSLLPPSTEARR